MTRRQSARVPAFAGMFAGLLSILVAIVLTVGGWEPDRFAMGLIVGGILQVAPQLRVGTSLQVIAPTNRTRAPCSARPATASTAGSPAPPSCVARWTASPPAAAPSSPP